MTATAAAQARTGLRSVDRGLVGLALIVGLSSLAPVQKYSGTAGVIVYLAGVSGVVLWGLRPLARWFTARVSERQALWLAAATLVALGVVFAGVYPIADAGVVGGGSDRENNLTEATAELLQGHFPYYVRSYLNLPPDILPGTMVLAAPFVLLGNSAYQNFFWLAALLVVARWLFRDARQALLLFWALLALAPAVLLEFVTGGELIANTLYVLIFMLALTRSAAAPGGNRWLPAVFAVLLGIALSSRINFVLLMPVVFSALGQRAGWRSAILYSGLVAVAFLAVTLPVYLSDPAEFAPAHYQNRFDLYGAVLPYAGLIVPALTGLVALGLGLRRADRAGFVLLSNCAIVQAFPIGVGHLLTILQTGSLKLSFGVEGWGLFCLFFGALAAWPAPANPGPELRSPSA